MADNVIKSFLVSLGVKVDEDGLRKFEGALKSLTTTTKVFAVGFSTLILSIEEALRRVGRSYTELFYLSEQTGISAKNLKTLEFGFNAIGISTDRLHAQINSLNETFISSPGMKAFVGQWVPNFNRATATAEDAIIGLAEEYKRRMSMGAGAEAQFFNMLRENGIDAMMIRQTATGNNLEIMRKHREEAAKVLRNFGLDANTASAQARDAMNKWDLVWLNVRTGFDKLSLTLLNSSSFQNLLQKFADWLGTEGAKKVKEWSDSLEKWLKDEKSQKSFNDNLQLALDVIKELAHWVGLLGKAFLFLNEHLGATTTLLLALLAPTGVKLLLQALLQGGINKLGLGAAAIGRQVCCQPGAGGGGGGPGEGGPGGGKGIDNRGRAAFTGFNILSLMYDMWNQGVGTKDYKEKEGGSLGIPKEWTEEKYGGLLNQWFPSLFGAKETDITGAKRPGTYEDAPFGGGRGGGQNYLEMIYFGFQHWWAGSGAFRPIMALAEEVYVKLEDMIREIFGLQITGKGEGEGGVPGGAAGGGRAGVAGGGRMPGHVSPGGGGPGGETGKLTIGQIKKLALDAGFNEEQASIMAATIMHESGGDPSAVNKSSGAAGLAQINPQAHGQALADESKGNARRSLEIAYRLFKERGYQPWQSYNTGAYLKYLEQAKQAKPEEYMPVTDPSAGGGGGVVKDPYGKRPGVSNVLKEAMDHAFKEVLPVGWKANITSGVRHGDPGAHGQGSALDVQLQRPDGSLVPNRGEDTTGYHRKAAVSAIAFMLEKYGPEVARQFAYGGHFGTEKSGGGPPDIMHYEHGFRGPRGRHGDPWSEYKEAVELVRKRKSGAQASMSSAGNAAMQLASAVDFGGGGDLATPGGGYNIARNLNTSNRNVNSNHSVAINVYGATDVAGVQEAVRRSQDRESTRHAQNLRTAIA